MNDRAAPSRPTFVDASAIVAVLNREPDADRFAAQLDAASDPVTSPVAVFEATLGVFRDQRGTVEQSRRDVTDFLARAGVRILPMPSDIGDLALFAFARYGKGQGHPAQLNLGDCFAYAMARHLGAAMLYKGEDFARTDIDIPPAG